MPSPISSISSLSSISPTPATNSHRQPKTPAAPDRPAADDNRAQDDAALLEQLIRRADRPIVPATPSRSVREARAAASDALPGGQASEPDAGPLIDDEILLAGGARGGFRSKEEGPSWWKVFASAAGAVATGALFGYLVLTLFSGSPPFAASPSGSSASPADAGQAVAAQAEPGGSGANPAQTSAGSEAADEMWPGATYYWLQYGVFRSPEAMDAAVQELRDAGLPGWGDASDGYRVFAGVAADKSEAERLAAQMPRHELFIKPIRIEDTEGSAEGLAFIEESGRLAGLLSRLSVAALQDELPEPFEPDELAALRDQYEQWRSSAAAVERWQGAQLQEARSMMEAFEAAMASVDRYESKVSRYHLWSVQADLMELLSAERKLREAFAAASA